MNFNVICSKFILLNADCQFFYFSKLNELKNNQLKFLIKIFSDLTNLSTSSTLTFVRIFFYQQNKFYQLFKSFFLVLFCTWFIIIYMLCEISATGLVNRPASRLHFSLDHPPWSSCNCIVWNLMSLPMYRSAHFLSIGPSWTKLGWSKLSFSLLVIQLLDICPLIIRKTSNYVANDWYLSI